MAKATISGLLIGVTKGAGDVLNREEAAQMIFNALEANTRVKSTTTGSDTSLVDGGSSYADVPNDEADDYRTSGKDAVEQLIEKYFPKAVYDNDADREGDAFKRPATVWKSGRTKITDELTKEPVLVYTAREVSSNKPEEKANDKVLGDLDGYGVYTYTEVIEETDTETGRLITRKLERRGTPVYKNGEEVEKIDFTNSDDLANKIATKYSGNGNLIEFYANDKDTQITRIVVADYNIKKVKKVDSKTGEITLENDDTIVKKDAFYAAVSSVVRDDFVLVAENKDGIADAYLPEEVAGVAISQISNETKRGREDATVTIGGTDYTWSHDAHVEGFVKNEKGDEIKVNVNDKGTALLDKYGYLVRYKRANETAADWALLKSVYTVDENNDFGEPSTDFFGLIVKEDASVESIPLFCVTDEDDPNFKTKANAATCEIIAKIIGYDPRTGITEVKDADVVQNGSHSWFIKSGKLVTYKETAAGYKLSTSDLDIEGNALSKGVNSSKDVLDKDSKAIDGIYLSSPLSVVTVSDKSNKASSVKATADSKISKKIDPNYDPANPSKKVTPYKYVWKKVGNNTLVATVFITGKTDDSKSLLVTKLVGPAAYGPGDSTGYKIEYYTDDSQDVQEGIITEESGEPKVTDLRIGRWYTTDEIKEGMTINKKDDKYSNVEINDTTYDTTAYGSSMKIEGVTYVFADDATVVDLDDIGIKTTDDLVSEIAKITAESGNDPIRITFTWKEDGDDLVVKQVYVNEVPKATTPSGQSGQTTNPDQGGQTTNPDQGGQTTNPDQGGQTNEPAQG